MANSQPLFSCVDTWIRSVLFNLKKSCLTYKALKIGVFNILPIFGNLPKLAKIKQCSTKSPPKVHQKNRPIHHGQWRPAKFSDKGTNSFSLYGNFLVKFVPLRVISRLQSRAHVGINHHHQSALAFQLSRSIYPKENRFFWNHHHLGSKE